MILRRTFLAGAGAMVSGCAAQTLPVYTGEKVTRVQVQKSARKLQLFHGSKLLKQYDFELGFAPVGHKVKYADGRTPEGTYRIDRKNPNSRYHMSIGISYPDLEDIARARALGLDPGGDIFIHGTPRREFGKADWTYGCIAVTDAEIEEIYAMVDVGTIIAIYP